jgi:hypothetical protein
MSSVILRTSLPSDPLHLTQYRVYVSWFMVGVYRECGYTHHSEIFRKDFQQPLESLARTRYRPLQPRGRMSFGNQRERRDARMIVTANGRSA